MVTEESCNLSEKQVDFPREMEPVQPVPKGIYQSNTYRKELSWPHFKDEPRVQETP